MAVHSNLNLSIEKVEVSVHIVYVKQKAHGMNPAHRALCRGLRHSPLCHPGWCVLAANANPKPCLKNHASQPCTPTKNVAWLPHLSPGNQSEIAVGGTIVVLSLGLQAVHLSTAMHPLTTNSDWMPYFCPSNQSGFADGSVWLCWDASWLGLRDTNYIIKCNVSHCQPYRLKEKEKENKRDV